MPLEVLALNSRPPSSAAATSSTVRPCRLMISTTSMRASSLALISAAFDHPADELDVAVVEHGCAVPCRQPHAGGAFSEARFVIVAAADEELVQESAVAVTVGSQFVAIWRLKCRVEPHVFRGIDNFLSGADDVFHVARKPEGELPHFLRSCFVEIQLLPARIGVAARRVGPRILRLQDATVDHETHVERRAGAGG